MLLKRSVFPTYTSWLHQRNMTINELERQKEFSHANTPGS